MANRCGPGSVLIVHQGEMGTGFCSSIPRYFDSYVQYIDRQPTLELTDVGEYDIERLYTVLYGPLEPGEYYNRRDLNGDGVTDFYKASEVDGEEQILTVYGRDDEFQKYEISYDDWLEQYGQNEGPDLSELIAEYGEDVVNDLKGKYDELVDFIGNVPEDPVGSIKKMAEIFVEGTTGIPPECEWVSGGPLDEWYKKCVTVGVLIEIGIPGLPSGIGGIFKGATIGEIEEALKTIGKKFEDIVDGNPTCGEDGTQECTPITILGDLGREVLDTIGSIFEDAEGEITVESVLGKLGGIFGTVLGGIIYEEFKDLINSEIEDVIGIPVIPFAPLAECEKKGQTTVETSEGSGQFQCGPCKQEGFKPIGPDGECVDPDVKTAGQPCQGPYNSTGETDEQGNCNFVEGADCQPPNEPAGTAGKIDASGNCIAVGGDDDDDDDDDDVTLTTEEQICKNTDRKYDDLNDICLQECDNPEYIILGDGNCGPDPNVTTSSDCPDGEVRRGGLDDGECVKPGNSCFSEPNQYSGDQLNITQGQFNSEGFCVDPNVGQGSCPNGNEPDYFPEDEDQDGAFEFDGYSYTYDPCDPTGKENTLIGTPIDDGGTETGGSCPEGSERDEPFYDSRDTDQSGFIVSNGITYSYDPCNPSSGFTMVGQNVGCSAEEEQQGKVTTANGDCVEIGSACLRSAFGQEYCSKTGYNTPYGVINSNGDCECPSTETGETCSDENRQQNPDGSCADKCKDNFEFDNNDKCVPIQQGSSPCEQINPATGQPSPKDDMGECVDCTDEANALACDWFDCGDNVYAPTRNDCPTAPPPIVCDPITDANADECGYKKCDNGTYVPKDEQCPIIVDPCETIDATNAEECGYKKCDDGTYIPKDQQCPITVDPCDDPVYASENQDECGPIVDSCDDPVYAAENPQECGYTCDDPNATVLEGGLTPGACGPCKEGYVFDGTVERCVQIEQPDPCNDPDYAAANPTECGTTPPPDCSDPEYAAANPEECMPSPPPPPETGGGGGGGGGGAGAFSPFIAGIDYTPQALPTPPAAPQKDYMMELDNLIKRSLFEGIV